MVDLRDPGPPRSFRPTLRRRTAVAAASGTPWTYLDVTLSELTHQIAHRCRVGSGFDQQTTEIVPQIARSRVTPDECPVLVNFVGAQEAPELGGDDILHP